jgi:hypothetical protein
MLPNAQTAQLAWPKIPTNRQLKNTLNRRLPKAFCQRIGNKHDVDDTRLENQWVAMEDVR